MWYLYVVMGLATLSVIAVVYLAIQTKITASKVPAKIVEKIYYDNTIGQRYAWIVQFNDGEDIRRLYNTIYKSNKSEPQVGDAVTMIKVVVFNKTKYVSKLQYYTSFILPTIMSISVLVFWYLLIFNF